MIDRADWNYDNSGNAIAPLAPSPEQVINEVAKQSSPSVATQLALADDLTLVSNQAASAKRGVDGIMREDWEKPRDDAGRYVLKSDTEMRAQWEREGAYQTNVQRVLAAEQEILTASENPEALRSHIGTLPDAIARKAADVLRLSTAYGPSGGALKAEQFLNSLSESEFQEVRRWFGGLSRSDQDAVIAGFFGK